MAAAEEADLLLAAAASLDELESLVLRREEGEPLAWLVGHVTFAGTKVLVRPGVYVPRQQSEQLARRAAALLAPGGRALDLCCGAGAIGAHLLASVPDVEVVGVDVDARAAACAATNGLLAVAGDVGSPLRATARFDVVTAVPPYVPTEAVPLLPADVPRFEPLAALDGGGDGLDLARRVVAAAATVLRPGGWLLVELGGEQDGVLAPTLARSGFGAAEPWHDEHGDLRGVAAQRISRPPSPA